jgi:hypothetical protein
MESLYPQGFSVRLSARPETQRKLGRSENGSVLVGGLVPFTLHARSAISKANNRTQQTRPNAALKRQGELPR